MMTHEFDRGYWESHWQQITRDAAGREVPVSPYLAREINGLAPGTALDAGCGTGAEALWLAERGWRVTGADISAAALASARAREGEAAVASPPVTWLEADLGEWEPAEPFNLVATHYAHADMPQLALYERLADWVAPGGTLLIVGHLHASEPRGSGHPADAHGHAGHPSTDASHGHAGNPPAEASVTAASIAGVLDPAYWEVVTAAETSRSMTDGAGRTVPLRDVVVRATRR
jgi:SAM-dependent methyltransferase